MAYVHSLKETLVFSAYEGAAQHKLHAWRERVLQRKLAHRL